MLTLSFLVAACLFCFLVTPGMAQVQPTHQELYDTVIREYAYVTVLLNIIGGEISQVGEFEFDLVRAALVLHTQNLVKALNLAEAASVAAVNADFKVIYDDFASVAGALSKLLDDNTKTQLTYLKQQEKRLLDLIAAETRYSTQEIINIVNGIARGPNGFVLAKVVNEIQRLDTKLQEALYDIQKNTKFIFDLGIIFQWAFDRLVEQVELINNQADIEVDGVKDDLLVDARNLADQVERRHKVIDKALKEALEKVVQNGKLLDVQRKYLIDLLTRTTTRNNGYNAGGPNVGKILGRAKIHGFKIKHDDRD